jgi:hypothetical protein
MPNLIALTAIGQAIRETADDPRTADGIRSLQQTEQGSEILRMIVRDNLGGAGSIIADALWSGL